VVSSLGERKSVQSTKLAITAISRIVCPEMQLREENHCLRFNTAERTDRRRTWTGAHSWRKRPKRLRAII